MECCGQKRDTCFCPDCGREMKDLHPLAGLLKHCRHAALSLRSNVRRARQTAEEESGENRAHRLRWADRNEKHLVKWEGWVKGLEKAIEVPGEPGEPDEPIEQLELSTRTKKVLKRAKITHLSQLLRTTDEVDLLSYKNFGQTSLNELNRFLEARGLKLGQDFAY